MDFLTTSSRECQQLCIEEGNHLFLALDERFGRCCDLTTHAVEGCDMGGIDTLDIAFKYRFQGAGSLMCPQEAFCGEKLFIAETDTKAMQAGGREWSDL